MKREDVATFEKLKAQLESIHQEMLMLAKKSPNDAVNAFKIKSVNATLKKCNAFFGAQYMPFHDFDLFSPDDLPSNSDVTFIVSQYIECAENFRTDNIASGGFGKWHWRTPGNGEKIPTSIPKKLANK